MMIQLPKKAKDEALDELLNRAVVEITVREHLRKRLENKEKLRVKLGIDPTGPKIHIGRAIQLWKLRQFQDLGHRIVLIIGDTTAQIGDPSDKLSKRPFLTKEMIQENLKGYLEQIGRILDIEKAEIRYNSEWLDKLTFREVAQLAESFSVNQMIARRNFKERWDRQEEISLREMMYPLMQGYDSVAVESDVELGGTDQLFNLHAGRTIQQKYEQAPQDVMTMEMLEGLDGRKMSTSWGNIITILDSPQDMYGKTMSMKDELIVKYFTLTCPHLKMEDVRRIEGDMKSEKLDPKSAKMMLALELTALYHGKDAALTAEAEFVRIFSERENPSNAPLYEMSQDSMQIIEVIVESGLSDTKSSAKRLIEQGGVEIEGEIMKDPKKALQKKEISGKILRAGKRRFVKFS